MNNSEQILSLFRHSHLLPKHIIDSTYQLNSLLTYRGYQTIYINDVLNQNDLVDIQMAIKNYRGEILQQIGCAYNNQTNQETFLIIYYFLPTTSFTLSKLEEIIFSIYETIDSDYVNQNIEQFNHVNAMLYNKRILLIIEPSNDKIIRQYLSNINIPTDCHIQVMHITNIIYNVMEYKYNSKHTIISDEQFRDVKKGHFHFKKEDLSRILCLVDHTAQYIGLLPGQICEITRHLPNIGESKDYKIGS